MTQGNRQIRQCMISVPSRLENTGRVVASAGCYDFCQWDGEGGHLAILSVAPRDSAGSQDHTIDTFYFLLSLNGFSLFPSAIYTPCFLSSALTLCSLHPRLLHMLRGSWSTNAKVDSS